MVEFKGFPKLSRWSRDVIISEKLDGTNSCVIIEKVDEFFSKFAGAQSRNKLITPEDDNYGFAAWAHSNGQFLADVLGPGHHYGEWWGQGIQRNYGLKRKKFSLFNTHRWNTIMETLSDEDKITTFRIGLDVVPTLWQGPMDEAQSQISWHMAMMKEHGSVAAPGFMNPEGVVIFHTAGGYLFKKTFEKDQEGKTK